jgi:hypothetical protein
MNPSNILILHRHAYDQDDGAPDVPSALEIPQAAALGCSPGLTTSAVGTHCDSLMNLEALSAFGDSRFSILWT